MSDLDRERVHAYFTSPGTVSEWWQPDEGPLRFHYDAELQVIRDHIPATRDMRVLDVGTGRGRFGAHFAQCGCQVVGIDLNEEMLASARERARRLEVGDRFELRHASAEDLSAFAPGTFHLALCMELFDHLPDLGRVLAEVHRVLQPAGQLVFTYVPSESLYGSLGNVYRWIRRRAAAAVPMISRTYSFGEIGRTLGEHGFQLERYWGVGLLCASAQTRLFQENLLIRALTAIARAEAERLPYYETPVLARRGAHVVGLARALPR